MEPKENLINETLQSLDSIGRAKANPYLFQKVLTRMEKQVVKPVTLRWALAIAIVIISLNLLGVIHHNKKSNETSGKSSFSSEYFSYLNNM